jgi:O-antigen ligase
LAGAWASVEAPSGRLATHTQELSMTRNEGTLDRGLRIAAGLVLIVLAATGTLGAWAWIGVVPLATGLMGWCPAYTLLGVNTCPAKKP